MRQEYIALKANYDIIAQSLAQASEELTAQRQTLEAKSRELVEYQLRLGIAEDKVDSLQKAFFKPLSHHLSNKGFYITSFSVREEDEDNDGFLSQWRSYGNVGGFSIVFSMNELKESYEEQFSLKRQVSSHNSNFKFIHFLEKVSYKRDIDENDYVQEPPKMAFPQSSIL
jgi:hypothetical protein